MTEQPYSSADDADPRVVEELAQLRSIEASPAARARFHDLVVAQLNSNGQPRSTVWWRRSVRVPLPVCVAAGLALIALLFLKFPRAADPSVAPMKPPAVVVTELRPALKTTSTYMLGVGELASETHYFFGEDQL